MIIKHNPPETVGDCFRCCIASLLELPAAAVPHFMEEDWGRTEGFAWYPRVNEFLRSFGLAYLEFSIPSEMEGPRWFEHIAGSGFGAHHVLSGRSPRADHSVIALNGVMVHDPAPQKDGLIGPHEDGMYAFGFLIHRGMR